MASNPTTPPPGGNVVPLNSPQMPWLRPPASPPGCFSQLYALNQCYDDILAMKQILAKVICDLATNDKEFQTCLANGIALAGAGSPIAGVVDGSNAAPGIVGEWVSFYQQQNYPVGAQVAQPVTMGVLQPGDWDLTAYAVFTTFMADAEFALNPVPTGASGSMFSIVAPLSMPLAALSLSSPLVRGSFSVPTLIVMELTTNNTANGPAAGTAGITFNARRMR